MDDLPDDAQGPKPCTACTDMTEPGELVRAPCGHEYCGECLDRLFLIAADDESSFPAKCCGEVLAIESYKQYLDPYVVQQFQEKAVEYGTSDRTYCHRGDCSTFLAPATYGGSTAYCDNCGEATCILCKGQAHGGECATDPGVDEVIQMAEQEGWRRCVGCGAMIERTEGCQHIICRCGVQFCYDCGRYWQDCQCPQPPEPDPMEEEELDPMEEDELHLMTEEELHQLGIL
ncbi:hypothetical protein GGS26DRAFT_593203 [Hypomontagnella submonticulosa]|nr:hypothetical protein GGS26DRAFT_593203 [Hypomontagnella submonticulosa]